MNQIVTTSGKKAVLDASAETRDYVTMYIAGQMFGIPVLTVQDVLGPQKFTQVPLAPKEIAGSLNLRGRIVTEVDVRSRLGLPSRAGERRDMSVVVDRDGELYSLMVDQVGEVLKVAASSFEPNPPTLDQRWRTFSKGVHRLDGHLLVILDIPKLLDFSRIE